MRIEIHFGVLHDTIEAQLNMQGLTLGEEAEKYEKIRNAINMCKFHVASSKEVENMFRRLKEKMLDDIKKINCEHKLEIVENYKKYIWETIEREQLSNRAHDAVEECIEEAKEFGVEDSIVVIEVEPYEAYVTADYFLELLLEETVNEEDIEIDEDFDIFDEKYKKEKEELEQVINIAIKKYIKDTGCVLNAYEVTEKERIVNLEEYEA